jgi:hypothetical protein
MKNNFNLKLISLILLLNTQVAFAQEKVVDDKRCKNIKLIQLNLDKDSKISKEDFMLAASAEFEKLDKNKDGFITRSELREFKSLKEEIRNFNENNEKHLKHLKKRNKVDMQ